MKRRLPACFVPALAVAVGGGSPAAAGSETLAANKVAPAAVRQDSAKAADIAVKLTAIKLPSGFRIALFALVPGARAMAVSGDGHKVFVGTNEDQAFVIDLKARGGPIASVKTFAPSIEWLGA